MAVASANSLIWHNRKLSALCIPSRILGGIIIGNSNSICSSNSLSNRRNRISIISCSAGITVSHVDQTDTSETSTRNSWSEFAGNVSGEWDGFGADFSNQGQPIELPESVVPEAYREWEVKVFDWQTQCPTLAQPEERSMLYKSIKLLPTVGCEADAATRYSTEERNIDKVRAFAYGSNGSYVAVWPIGDSVFEVEHCLINPKDKESRVRIYQVTRADETEMVLQNIRVFCEHWYGPFRNGEQLGGCAIRESGFASMPPITASEVVGTWEGHHAVALFDGSNTSYIAEVTDERATKFTRQESNLILLPRQLWCSLNKAKDGEAYSEVGWLFEQGRAVTSRCVFSNDAKLKEITIAQETAVSEGV